MADHGTNSKGFKLQGKTSVQGLQVAIENRKGSVREGKNDDGSKWKTKYKIPYGYIEGTKGADGEEVDAYVGPDKESPKAYVVKQKKDDGSYDEDTVMLGFKSKAKARKAILQHYDDPKYIGATKAVPVEELKRELAQARKKTAAVAKKPSMYEKMKVEAPVPVLEGKKGHPLEALGGAYFPSGAPWLLRKAHAKEDLPKDPFIYAGDPKSRFQIDSLLTGKVDASPEAVMAHEVGHARDKLEGGLAGKILQRPLVRGGSQFLGMMAGLGGGAATRIALRDKPLLGIPASIAVGALGGGLGHVPTLLSERRATDVGLEKLRSAGATEEEVDQYKKELASAYGSYKRSALSGALLTGALAPWVGGRSMLKAGEAKTTGAYKGQPMSPHTVKFKTDFQGIPINIDRPRGFIMKGTDKAGNDWARRYRYNYGFIPKTLGGDGDGLDVFIGPLKKAQYAYWVVQRKDDGSFDEYKVFLGFPDRDAATAAYRQHVPKKYFKGIITMKIQMMKAMLGKFDPEEKFNRGMNKQACAGFLSELLWMQTHAV